MKKSILALSALTLALGVGLSACGGGKSTYTVGGTVLNLTYGPLVLVTNGMTIEVNPTKQGVSEDVKYSFKDQLEYGEVYDVNLVQIGTQDNAEKTPIYKQPDHQTCAAYSGTKDTAGRLTTINAVITCVLNAYPVSGKVYGLTSTGLELGNGSTVASIAITKKEDGSAVDFAFPTVAYGYTYGITVVKQPATQICTVDNGTGVMGDAAVTTVSVNCVNKPT
ncbi:hypothetical protein G4G28_23025 [Massilia sp. Dwa41.01b]|uniref:hypothetical protein n=1 Tax=unclassified Massilia TaxID=2609279 RepID=UPI001601EFFF|nr:MULTISPECIES: hypothetical protein [unclassified Massilia]QNA90663.1 hypothetical protein G4G28_23025 [Massilia sp. Dwa41.01b]QNA97895.1 hypothetical protein G4G31_02095 [Massilia sp. Se16.2.3]